MCNHFAGQLPIRSSALNLRPTCVLLARAARFIITARSLAVGAEAEAEAEADTGAVASAVAIAVTTERRSYDKSDTIGAAHSPIN